MASTSSFDRPVGAVLDDCSFSPGVNVLYLVPFSDGFDGVAFIWPAEAGVAFFFLNILFAASLSYELKTKTNENGDYLVVLRGKTKTNKKQAE